MLLAVTLELCRHDHVLNIHGKKIIAGLVHLELRVADCLSAAQRQCLVILAFCISDIARQPAFISNGLVREELEHLALAGFHLA